MAKSKPSEYARSQVAKRIFEAKTVKRGWGGILYRNVPEIEERSSLAYLKQVVLERGFHLVRIGDNYVIICGKPEIEIIC